MYLPAKQWMEAQLAQWRKDNNRGPAKTPFPNWWYWDLKVEVIKAGYLKKRHNKKMFSGLGSQGCVGAGCAWMQLPYARYHQHCNACL